MKKFFKFRARCDLSVQQEANVEEDKKSNAK